MCAWLEKVPPRRRLPVPGWFVAAALLALALRAALYLQYLSSPFLDGLLLDAALYWRQSGEIASGGWLPREVFHQGPLYPYLLALLRYAFPSFSPAGVAALQLLLNWATCLLLLPLVRRWRGEETALAASSLALFFAPAAFYALKVLAPVFGLLLLVLGLLCLPRGGARSVHLAAAGLLLGLASLCVPGLLLAAAAVALFLVLRIPRTSLLPSLGAFLAALALPIAPVTLSNHRIDGSWVLISSNYGITFASGNGPGTAGMYLTPRGVSSDIFRQAATSAARARRETGRFLTQGQTARHWLRKGMAYLADDPARALVLVGRKARLLAGGREISPEYSFPRERRDSLPLLWLFPLGGTALLLLTALSLADREARRGLLLFQLLALSQAILCLAFFVSSRYTLPFQFLLLPAAAAGLLSIVRVVRSPPALLAALLVLAAAASTAGTGSGPGFEGAYLHRLATALNASGEREKASLILKDLADRPAFPSGVLLAAAHSYARAGELDAAIRAAGRALDLAPGDPTAMSLLGDLLQRTGRFGEAEGYLRRALAADSLDAESRVLLGRVLQKSERLDEAERELREAVRVDPYLPSARLALGKALLEGGEATEAEGEIHRAVELDPADPEANHLLGILAFEGGDYLQADRYLSRAKAAGWPVDEALGARARENLHR